MASKKTFIGRAFISITGDKKGLDKVLSQVREGMQTLGRELQKIGVKMMAVGTAIQAPLTAATIAFAKLGSEMGHAAERAGVTTDAFSELAYAAEMSGSSVGALEKAFIVMHKSIYQLMKGTGPAVKAFKDLGISAEDLKGRDAAAQMGIIADKLAGVSDHGRAVSDAMKIFGKAGVGLLPMLQSGSAGLAEYREQARRLGVSLGEEAAGKAERLDKMLERLKLSFKGVTMTVGAILAEGMSKLLVYLTNLIANVREFLANNPQVVSGLQQIAIALVAIGAAFVAIGTASRALSILVSPGGVLFALLAILVWVSGAFDPLIEKFRKWIETTEVGGLSIMSWLQLIAKSLGVLWATFVQSLKDLLPMLSRFGDLVLEIADSVWERMKLGIRELVVFIMDSFLKVSSGLADALEKTAEEMGTRGLIGGIPGKITMAMSSMTDSLANALTQKMPGMAQGVLEARAASTAQRQRTADSARAFGDAVGSSFGSAATTWKSGLGGLAEEWGTALKPLLDKIFGEAGPAGGVKNLWDVFTGLGRQWKDMGKAIAPTTAATPELLMATGTTGTFSALGARQMAANESPLLKLGKKAVELLGEIRDNTAEGGIGSADWSGEG